MAPAIRLAEEGYPVAPVTAYFWGRGAQRQLSTAPNGHELTIDGRAPRPGEIFRNPYLADTLETIAKKGRDEFYKGKIAKVIAFIFSSNILHYTRHLSNGYTV